MTDSSSGLASKTHTYISLFSGAGGLDYGVEIARSSSGIGFRSGLAVENDSNASETLRAAASAGIFSSTFEVLPDARSLGIDDIRHSLKISGNDVEDVALVVGGPPCPSFSTAGKRGAVEDDRGQLVFDFLDVVDKVKPRFFLMENVKGLLSSAVKHRPLDQRGVNAAPLTREEQLGSALRLILRRMEEIGYQVVQGTANSANYGSPQLRHRALFFGSRDSEFPADATIEDLMPRTHHKDPSGEQLGWRTLRDAIKYPPIPDPPEFQRYSEDRRKWFEMIPAGSNWRHLRDNVSVEAAAIAMGGAWNSTGGRVGFYRRLDWDRPSPTLLTSPVQKATGFCHPDELRPLSIQEYARVQEFPDEYPFVGSIAQRYRQIGNAVPISLAKAAGEAILRIMESRDGS
ncbi:DNA cytosine methyltransferase [Candidatus Lucifugimonas marina]|uniref:DNA cytosine methyltransferase n=1 Tax=Candidatus Lucifugimonas marina TaxID=3038979 RepID=UPI00319DA7B3